MGEALGAAALAMGVVLVGCGDHGGDTGGVLDRVAPGPPAPSSDASSEGGTTLGDSGLACVADLKADPANCGACGHSCLGGACAGGVCRPVVLASAERLRWRGLGVDGQDVYFLQS